MDACQLPKVENFPRKTDNFYILVSSMEEGDRYLESGTLWQLVGKPVSPDIATFELLEPSEGISNLTCPQSHMAQIGKDYFNLFLAIKEPANRLMVFVDTEWRMEGLEMRCGDTIQIINHPVKDLNGLLGTIRFKGELNNPYKKGTYFGIELFLEGKGYSNGYYCNQQLFKCSDYSAVFLSIFCIRRVSLQKPALDYSSCSSVPMHLGERVVWMSENGPENGTVRWLGALPEDESFSVGVEFDNPVGMGSGKYRGRQLFAAEKRHASILPPNSLIRYYEYYNGKGEPLLQGNTGRRIEKRSLLSESDTQTPAINIAKASISYDKNANTYTTSHGIPAFTIGNTIVTKPGIAQSITTSCLGSCRMSVFAPSNILERALTYPTPGFLPLSGVSQSMLDPTFYKRQLEKAAKMERIRGLTRVSGADTSFMETTSVLGEADYQGQVFKIGDKVEVEMSGTRFGILKWLGQMPVGEHKSLKVVAGLEMEDIDTRCYTDGSFQGIKLFECMPFRSLFLYVSKLKKDSRK